MTTFRDTLGNEEIVSLEVTPPHGTSLAGLEPTLRAAQGRADILDLTDNAMAHMKLSAIALGNIIQETHGIEVMINMGMRDRNVLALQSDLLGAHALGLRTVVALKGDRAASGDHPDAHEVFEGNALRLLHIIGELNAGRSLAGVALDGPTAFLAGTVTNPTHEDRAAEAARLGRRAKAGARFALTQPVFALEQLTDFLDACPEPIPLLLVGLLPLKSLKFARFLANKVPGIHIPPTVMARMEQAAGTTAETELGLTLAEELAGAIREAGSPQVAGLHIMSGGGDSMALNLLTRLRPTAATARTASRAAAGK